MIALREALQHTCDGQKNSEDCCCRSDRRRGFAVDRRDRDQPLSRLYRARSRQCGAQRQRNDSDRCLGQLDSGRLRTLCGDRIAVAEWHSDTSRGHIVTRKIPWLRGQYAAHRPRDRHTRRQRHGATTPGRIATGLPRRARHDARRHRGGRRSSVAGHADCAESCLVRRRAQSDLARQHREYRCVRHHNTGRGRKLPSICSCTDRQ